MLLLLKLTLAPGLVGATTLAGRRFGPRVAGLLGGLPVVVGPVLLALALAHGRAFAATAARGTLAGLLSLCAFIVAYAWCARVWAWPRALAGGWLAFALATLALDHVRLPAGAALAAVTACFAITALVLPRPSAASPGAAPPRFDLVLRMGATAGLVLTLTGAARALGPHLSGLLAAFPVLASVLAVFTHRHEGADAAGEFLLGLVGGLGGFTVFCFVVAELLPGTGVGISFGAASVAALAVGALATARGTRGGVRLGTQPAEAAAVAER